MNSAQRRQTAGTAKQDRKKGIAPPVAANLTSDVIRDMEIAVGFHQTGELMRAGVGGFVNRSLIAVPTLWSWFAPATCWNILVDSKLSMCCRSGAGSYKQVGFCASLYLN